MISALVSLLIPGFAALLAGLTLWPERLGPALRVALFFPAGWGISSILFFVWTLLASPPGSDFMALELALFGMALFAWLAVRQKRGPEKDTPETATQEEEASGALSLPQLLVIVVVLVFATLAVWRFTATTKEAPHGHWDAQSLWNLKSRFLHRGEGEWRRLFTLHWGSHPDYPLGLPALVASRWAGYDRSGSQGAPVALALGMALMTSLLLYAALKRAQGVWAASLGLLVFLTAFSFFDLAAGQLADVPLALYLLGFFALFILALNEKQKGANPLFFIIAAGFFAGIMPWIKNEGMAYFAAATIGIGLWRRGALRPFLAGAGPGLLTTALFKWTSPAANDIFNADRGGEIVGLIFSLDRHVLIASRLGGEILYFDGLYGVSFSILLMVVVVVWTKKERQEGPPLMVVAAPLALMVAAVWLAYVATPHDLKWHLDTSASRIVAQFWPALVMVVLAAGKVVRQEGSA